MMSIGWVEWTEITSASTLPSRDVVMLAYGAIQRQLVRYGGTTPGGDFVSDTWALRFESTSPIEQCLRATADDDGDGLAGCADPDCWGRCTPLCPPGTSCPTNAPACGDAICQQIEDVFVCPADCSP